VNRTVITAFCLLLVFSTFSFAQSKPGAAGHWEGSITLPNGALKVIVDLDRDAKGAWIGDIDIPDQGVKDLSLRAIAVSGDAVSFELTISAGGPKFDGKVAEDDNTITGNFTQAGSSFPLSLKRTGDAKVVQEPRNAELPAKFTGKWEGSLDAMGNSLRLVFNLDNKEGSAFGTIDSPDQGANGLPLNEISVTEDSIKISVKIVGGSFNAKLSADGKGMTGEWSQAGNTLPLVLKKAAPAKN